jgi:hypothetical protein
LIDGLNIHTVTNLFAVDLSVMNNNSAQNNESKKIWLPWQEDGWLERVTTWIDDHLALAGRQRSGDVELLHQRPWSAFTRVPTNRGTVYFKAPAPSSVSEARLTAALGRWRPDCTVPVLAIEAELGWLLTVDAGVTLRELSRTPEQLKHWQRILPLYAGLQRELSDRVPELLALGVTDRRLALLPEKFEILLEDTENLRVGLPKGLTADEHRKLLRLQSRFATHCQELLATGIPETLTHEEVTEVNVILGEGGYRFTDWDNGVSFPFFSLLTTLRSIAHWLKPPPEKAQMDHLRDLYLEQWSDIASRSELLEVFKIAYGLAMVNRALSYHRTFASLPQSYKIEYDGIAAWLREYLAAEEAS